MSEIESVYFESLREMQATARGAHGLTHGSRPKRPRLSVSAPVADMVVRKNGREVVIPASWMTRTGTIRKSYRARYDRLLA